MEQKMNRREFMTAAATGLVAAVVSADKINEWDKEYRKDKFFNSCSNKTIKAYHTTTVDYKGKLIDIETEGNGVLMGGKYYLTLDHIARQRQTMMPTPFGIISMSYDVKGGQSYINKEKTQPLEEILCCPKTDIAVFKLPAQYKGNYYVYDENWVERRTWKTGWTDKYQLGDQVYIIGDPRLTGQNIRDGIISDFDGNPQVPFPDVFGVSAAVIPGDSGTPVVNENLQLLGFSQYMFNVLGYVKKIKPFLDVIREHELKTR